MKNFLRYINKNRIVTSVILITLIGTILRLQILHKTSLWYDEAYTALNVKQNWADMFKTIIQDKVHPPLYYILLKVWGILFGYSEVALRSLSLLFGITLIPLTYTVVKSIKNNLAGIYASILTAFSPFFITYSIEMRSYSMLCVEALISIYFFWKIWNSNNNLILIKSSINFRWLIFSCIILITTHYLSILLIFAYIVLLLYKLKGSKLRFNPTTILLGLIMIIVLITSLLHISSFRVIPKESTPTPWLHDARLIDIPRLGYTYLFGVDRQSLGELPVFQLGIPLEVNDAALIIILIMALLIGYSIFKKNDIATKYLLILLFAGLIPILILSFLGLNLLLERYLITLGLIHLLLCGVLLSNIKIKNGILLILIYIILALTIKWQFSNPPYEDFANKIIQNSPKYKKIVIENVFDYQVLKYYINKKVNNVFLLEDPQRSVKSWPLIDETNIIKSYDSTDYFISKL